MNLEERMAIFGELCFKILQKLDGKEDGVMVQVKAFKELSKFLKYRSDFYYSSLEAEFEAFEGIIRNFDDDIQEINEGREGENMAQELQEQMTIAGQLCFEVQQAFAGGSEGLQVGAQKAERERLAAEAARKKT